MPGVWLRWRATTLAILLILQGTACAARTTPADRVKVGCDLAIEIIDRAASTAGPFVFGGRARMGVSTRDQLMGGWDGRRPAAGLVRDYLAQQDVAATDACPDLRARLTARGIGYGEAAVASATHGGRYDLPYSPSILSLSRPIVSADGRYALVDFGMVCGGLCGSGGVTLYAREEAGKWKAVGHGPQWIS
jgi:hypothetical protein